jgi:hypothetical protein
MCPASTHPLLSLFVNKEVAKMLVFVCLILSLVTSCLAGREDRILDLKIPVGYSVDEVSLSYGRRRTGDAVLVSIQQGDHHICTAMRLPVGEPVFISEFLFFTSFCPFNSISFQTDLTPMWSRIVSAT